MIRLALTLVLAALPAHAAPKHAAKVVLIGIDAVSLNVLEPYVKAGVTPNLAKLMREGTHGHLDSFWPTRTPQVWTTIATGKLPGQHGVWDNQSHTYLVPPELRTKDKRVVTVEARKSKALWNILDEKGLRSLVVGWMVTWPAEKLANAVIVAPKELPNDQRQTTIKGSFYRDVEQMVQPASLSSKAKSLITEPGDVKDTELASFAAVPPKGSPLYELPSLARYLYTFKWSHARARSVEQLTVGLFEDARPDVVLSYFQCPDTMGHRFWIFKESQAYVEQRLRDLKLPTKHAAELRERFGHAFETCYRDADLRLGRILEAARGPDTLVLVVSDHGFGHCERPHPFRSEPYGGVHLDEGVVIAAGPGVKAGATIEGMSVTDVTPTLLYYLGLPVGEDMRGKVARGLFAEDFLAKHPLATIPTYERAPQTACAYEQGGYPPRKTPPRPVREQLGGRDPYE